MARLTAAWKAIVLALDLDDGRGGTSFSKLVILALTVVAIRLLWPAKITEVGAWAVTLILVLIAGAMGRSVLVKLIERWKHP